MKLCTLPQLQDVVTTERPRPDLNVDSCHQDRMSHLTRSLSLHSLLEVAVWPQVILCCFSNIRETAPGQIFISFLYLIRK
ncbi:hypothetical protein GDO81_020073 [Engystomops pustulosus]|uniref:Uncharacterized protein n=1 Tax=Engystomops pustulosus TaxID=76066 RepID=A0AAV6YSE2_ENGPU|nr:hypothetical protein GDO81_020073 [Engystomops pustulosus]